MFADGALWYDAYRWAGADHFA